MRNFKKIMLPLISMVLVVAVVNTGMNYALIPYSYVRIMMHNIETQDYDVVFLGTSHGLSGISPRVIEEKTGKKSVNLCMGGEYPKDAYYLLKQVCERSIPDMVVYELDPGYWCTPEGQRGDFNRIYYEMPLSLTKLEYFTAKVAEIDFRATLFPWFYYRGQFPNFKGIMSCKQSEEYENYGAAPFTNEIQAYEDGYLRHKAVPGAKQETSLELWNEENKNEDSFRYFEKMASFCEKKGIQLVVITTPVPTETLAAHGEAFQKADEFFSEYLEEQGISYYNYSESDREITGFDRSLTMFMDYEGHMCKEQAEALSAKLAEDIIEGTKLKQN